MIDKSVSWVEMKNALVCILDGDFMTNKQSKYRSYIKFLFLGLFIVFLFFADQYTKYLAVRNLSGRKEISFISGLISFSYVENRGMAWGMLSGKIVFFIVLTGLLIAFIAYSICRIEKLTVLMPPKNRTLYFFTVLSVHIDCRCFWKSCRIVSKMDMLLIL